MHGTLTGHPSRRWHSPGPRLLGEMIRDGFHAGTGHADRACGTDGMTAAADRGSLAARGHAARSLPRHGRSRLRLAQSMRGILAPAWATLDARGQLGMRTSISRTRTDVSRTRTDNSRTRTSISRTRTSISRTRTSISRTRTDNSRTARVFLAPARTILAPARVFLAPARTILAPARMFLAPARTILAPARTILAPARVLLAPARPTAVDDGMSRGEPSRTRPGLLVSMLRFRSA